VRLLHNSAKFWDLAGEEHATTGERHLASGPSLPTTYFPEHVAPNASNYPFIRSRHADSIGFIDLTLVNSIHPGTTETDIGDQVLAMRARNLGINNLYQARQRALARLPTGRMGTAIDIANGIVFLASDGAGFMTGAGLVVDGASPRSDPLL
jgi:hypothetical protein